MELSKESLTIAWCDNGLTDGKFTQGIVFTILEAPKMGIYVKNAIRVQGNQLSRQRQEVLDGWVDGLATDWILWVDSDIVLTPAILMTLWITANKVTHPVVSGIYFISTQGEGTLAYPMPSIFKDINETTMQHIHPLPQNEVIKIDCSGMGLLLMHKSIVPKLREAFPGESMFVEKDNIGERHVSEDIVFFRKLKAAGIPVHAHTGAIAQHMKRFNLDEKYYVMWWDSLLRDKKSGPK